MLPSLPPPESAYVGYPLQRMEAGQAPLWVVPELQGLLGYEVGFPQRDSRGGAHGHDAA